MLQPNRESAPLERVDTALVVDFEAAKARRHDQRLADAEGKAAHALAEFQAGSGSLSDVLAALVAPFNRDPV